MQHLISRLFFLIVPVASFQVSFALESFNEPLSGDSDFPSNTSLAIPESKVWKRDGTCPINHNSCSTLAAEYGGACCPTDSLCTTDASHQIACCTTGAKCTGTLNNPTFTETADIPPTRPTMTITSSDGAYESPTMTGSVVNNIYFPFPYSPTTFPDRGACLSAINVCDKNYKACTANLESTNYGVTIIAPAGGITVAPTAQNLGVSSATRICSSLSSQACYDIQPSDCNQFGATFATPTSANGVAVARPIVGWPLLVGIVAAMGRGIAR